jgi:hypothetical protein
MEKKRKKATKKVAKKAIAHFKDDIEYYKKEAKEDRKNIAEIRRKGKVPKKKIISHLKGDSKGFKEEIKEDKGLIKTLRKKTNGKKKSSQKACCDDCKRGKSCAGKRKQNAKKTRRVQRRRVQKG